MAQANHEPTAPAPAAHPVRRALIPIVDALDDEISVVSALECAVAGLEVNDKRGRTGIEELLSQHFKRMEEIHDLLEEIRTSEGAEEDESGEVEKRDEGNTSPAPAPDTEFAKSVGEKISSLYDDLTAIDEFCDAIVGFLSCDVSKEDETLGGAIHRIGREIARHSDIISDALDDIMKRLLPPHPFEKADAGDGEVEEVGEA